MMVSTAEIEMEEVTSSSSPSSGAPEDLNHNIEYVSPSVIKPPQPQTSRVISGSTGTFSVSVVGNSVKPALVLLPDFLMRSEATYAYLLQQQVVSHKVTAPLGSHFCLYYLNWTFETKTVEAAPQWDTLALSLKETLAELQLTSCLICAHGSVSLLALELAFISGSLVHAVLLVNPSQNALTISDRVKFRVMSGVFGSSLHSFFSTKPFSCRCEARRAPSYSPHTRALIRSYSQRTSPDWTSARQTFEALILTDMRKAEEAVSLTSLLDAARTQHVRLNCPQSTNCAQQVLRAVLLFLQSISYLPAVKVALPVPVPEDSSSLNINPHTWVVPGLDKY